MASTELKVFVEDRLRALDPTIDLDAGSPAQTQFIEPLLTYLGTDPFETDIDSFITDRMSQEFPELITADPGVIRDTFVKPLIMLLTPFQREIQSIKRNQSLQDPNILSDDDADALVANVYDERDPGSFATGPARIFFSNPTNIQIEITTRVFTASGLSFFPTNPTSITAEEMAFNKSGAQYFLDVQVKAEKEGSEYNIDIDTLTGVEGIFGAVRVTNLQKFSNGSPRIDTPTFVAQARQSLNERSLNTRRGATARLNDVFQTELRAVQVIGAEDPEMQRDILVATSPGHQWITGRVTFWKNLALVQARTIDGVESEAPKQGDTLYCYLDNVSFPSILQTTRFVRLTVEEVYLGPVPSASPFQTTYLVRFSGSFPTGVTITNGSAYEGGFARNSNVAISSLPTIGQTNFSVPSGDVHVFGHTDFYVRPILQPSSTAVINGLSDSGSLVERLTLQTFGLSTEKNRVSDPGLPSINFESIGILPGDLLNVETGDDIGVYSIIRVSTNNLYLATNLSSSQSNLRYRIIRKIKIDPFEPKIPKFPFGSLLANDMQTVIGSNVLQLLTNDVIGFGAAVGDVVRIKTGIIAGDYTIVGFDPILGGQGLIVDRPASASLNNLQYEVFTALENIEKPLVRIKDFTLLDSSSQSTGISVPLAEPLGVTPTRAFTSARVRGGSQRVSGFVAPSLKTTPSTTYLSGGPVAAPSGDRRYSLGFDTPVGWYFPMQFADGTFSEFDFRANPISGIGDALDPASYFVAISESEDESENFPPIDPRPGECLSIKNGPNKGNYLIKNVVKFKHRLTAPTRTVWTYFIKIYGQFPVDPIGQLFDFLNTIGGGAAVVELPITGTTSYPTFFQNLYNSLGAKLNSALTTLGVISPPSSTILQTSIESMVFCDYEWGDPARGVLRSYFLTPTVFESKTGDSNPTEFVFKNESGEIVKFRPDPNRYREQELIPPRLTSDSDPKDYPRDAQIAGQLTYGTQTSNFTIGRTLTGQSSGATATILGDVDSGATGTLTLTNIVGEFRVGEIIVDNNGTPGSATVTSYPIFNGSSITFTDPGRVSVAVLGVKEGDVVSIHEEVFFHGNSYARQSVIETIAGSSQVTAPTSAGNIFNKDMVGNLFFIEEGVDKGAYRVVKFIDGRNIVLDSVMNESTPTILSQGNVNQWGYNGSNNVIISTGTDFTPFINKYITVFGIPYNFQGSYLITSAPVLGTAVITRVSNFPAVLTEADANFLITESPATPPTASLSGTELYAARPFRMYESVTKNIEITSLIFNDLAVSRVSFNPSTTIRVGFKQPFRVFRKDIRRVTPSEMESNKFGPVCYFDTEVVSFGPQDSSNIKSESYLQVREGSFDSIGYRHIVKDRTLTYSMKEEGTVEFTPQILPIGSSDSKDNLLNLVGSALQVTYDQSELVRRIQEFASSAQDRISSANILVRHFLPSYVSYDASYVGGSAPSVIAEDIFSYIDNVPVETPIDVSEIQDLIAKRGGNPITPTFVQTIIHDWKRRAWLEFSSNQLGGTDTSVPYDGTARVSYSTPGQDVSGQDPVPSGERINLTRE